METKRNWKQNHRLDSVLNVLLIVFALSVLGLSAIEVQIDSAHADTSQSA